VDDADQRGLVPFAREDHGTLHGDFRRNWGENTKKKKERSRRRKNVKKLVNNMNIVLSHGMAANIQRKNQWPNGPASQMVSKSVNRVGSHVISTCNDPQVGLGNGNRVRRPSKLYI